MVVTKIATKKNQEKANNSPSYRCAGTNHSKMKNESVKESLEKSKKVLEEKRKMVKRKICIKKDQHVYNNCYELRSRAIKNTLHHRRIPELNRIEN